MESALDGGELAQVGQEEQPSDNSNKNKKKKNKKKNKGKANTSVGGDHDEPEEHAEQAEDPEPQPTSALVPVAEVPIQANGAVEPVAPAEPTEILVTDSLEPTDSSVAAAAMPPAPCSPAPPKEDGPDQERPSPSGISVKELTRQLSAASPQASAAQPVSQATTPMPKLVSPGMVLPTSSQPPQPASSPAAPAATAAAAWTSTPNSQRTTKEQAAGVASPPVVARSAHDSRNTTNAAQLLKLGAFKLQPLQDWVAYEELVKLRLEDGIDPTRKEDYLEAMDFTRVFGMDRDAFGKLPAWRRMDLKKKTLLF